MEKIIAAALVVLASLGVYAARMRDEAMTLWRALESQPAARAQIDDALRAFDGPVVTSQVVLAQMELAPVRRRLADILDTAATRLGQSVEDALCEAYHGHRFGAQPPTADDIATGLASGLVGVPDPLQAASSIVDQMAKVAQAEPTEVSTVSRDASANIAAVITCLLRE